MEESGRVGWKSLRVRKCRWERAWRCGGWKEEKDHEEEVPKVKVRQCVKKSCRGHERRVEVKSKRERRKRNCRKKNIWTGKNKTEEKEERQQGKKSEKRGKRSGERE